MSYPLRLAIPMTVFLISVTSSALETDQYMAWGEHLNDSSHALESYLEKQTNSVLQRVNQGRNWKSRDCWSIALEISKTEKSTLSFIDHIEDWAFDRGEVDTFPSYKFERNSTTETSVYREAFFRRFLPLGKTMEVYDVRFGTDKLSHFITVGGEYLKRYLETLRTGGTKNQAILAGVNYGIYTENNFFGYTSSGVFSYADLESNFQGMNYLRSFCEGKDPLLQQTLRGWELSRRINLEPYINPYWDESFYPSHMLANLFSKVKPYLMTHCPNLDTWWIRRQKNRYTEKVQELPEHLGMKQVNLLITQGILIDPSRTQSLEAICPKQ